MLFFEFWGPNLLCANNPTTGPPPPSPPPPKRAPISYPPPAHSGPGAKALGQPFLPVVQPSAGREWSKSARGSEAGGTRTPDAAVPARRERPARAVPIPQPDGQRLGPRGQRTEAGDRFGHVNADG